MEDLKTYDKETEITQLKNELDSTYKEIERLKIIVDHYRRMGRFMRFVAEEFWNAY